MTLNNNYTEKQAFEFLNVLQPYQILKLSGLFTKNKNLR